MAVWKFQDGKVEPLEREPEDETRLRQGSGAASQGRETGETDVSRKGRKADEGIATPAAGMPPKREAEVGARRESAGSCLGTGEVENLETVQIGETISGAGRSDAKWPTATADADPVSAKSSNESETDPDDLLDEAELPGESKKRRTVAKNAASENIDWVEETYKCFVKDAKDIDPTDPVKAIEVYFEKSATDELKARCKAEGKDAKGCWKFVEAVARKALGGSSGHIDPAVVYAIAMHWFEDVPAGWDKVARGGARASGPASAGKQKKPAKKSAAKKAGGKKAAKQGFFFEMLETQAEGGTEK